MRNYLFFLVAVIIFAIAVTVNFSCNKDEPIYTMTESEYFSKLNKILETNYRNPFSVQVSDLEKLQRGMTTYNFPCQERLDMITKVSALNENDHYKFSIINVKATLGNDESKLAIFKKILAVLDSSQEFALKMYSTSIFRLGEHELENVLI